MRDDETGSWWQQVSGEAIHGTFKGKKLNAVFNDEISFAVWKNEHPNGRVLRPDERVAKKYEAANWEDEYAKFPIVTPKNPLDIFAPRTLIAGITINNKSKAYPVEEIQKSKLILDVIGTTPIFLVIGEDKKSVRAFERTMDEHVLEFLVKTDSEQLQIVDAETATVWDFSGKGVSGTLVGRQLKPVPVLKDYWFDWKIYHPDSLVFTLGARATPARP